MKNIIIIILMLLSITLNAQNKRINRNKDKSTGVALTSVGILSMSIGFLVPDGSEWTFSKGYNSTVITKPFYKNPSRVACIGIGLTISIGGIYQTLKKY